MGKSWNKWGKAAKSGEKRQKAVNFFHKMAGGGHFG